jgi:hypothetical protein
MSVIFRKMLVFAVFFGVISAIRPIGVGGAFLDYRIDYGISSAGAQTPATMPKRERCRKGIDCCWIGKKPSSNEYSTATDTSNASGPEVLALGGYTEIVFGPGRPASCASHWKNVISLRLVSSKPLTVFENWNPGGCRTTDRAGFRIDVPTQLTEIVVWYAWRRREVSAPFVLVGNGATVARGVLSRGACDPQQAIWCEARAMVTVDAAPGDWAIGVGDARICRNEASGDNGFVRVIGVR